MSSPTLKKILEHWNEPFGGHDGSIDLPFDVEAFCAEIDSLFAENRKLTKRVESLEGGLQRISEGRWEENPQWFADQVLESADSTGREDEG